MTTTTRTIITANFPDGKSDAAFYYRSDTTFDKTPFFTVADQINLSNPDFAGQYAQASYTTNIGQTFHGQPIQYSIAPLRDGNTHAAGAATRLPFLPITAGQVALTSTTTALTSTGVTGRDRAGYEG